MQKIWLSFSAAKHFTLFCRRDCRPWDMLALNDDKMRECACQNTWETERALYYKLIMVDFWGCHMSGYTDNENAFRFPLIVFKSLLVFSSGQDMVVCERMIGRRTISSLLKRLSDWTIMRRRGKERSPPLTYQDRKIRRLWTQMSSNNWYTTVQYAAKVELIVILIFWTMWGNADCWGSAKCFQI